MGADPNGAQVLVAGAGFAGLAAAYALHKSGLRVQVLEARRRSGGRVWSPRLANGALVEMGGEWISPQDEVLRGLAGELGLRLAPVGVDFFTRRVVGAPVDAAQLEAAGRLAGSALEALDPHEVASLSLGSFLDGLPLDEGVRAAFCARLQGSAGAPLERIALASYAGDAFGFHGQGPFFRLAGGNQSLAAAIESRLPSILYGHTLAHVEQHAGGVRLHCRTLDGMAVLQADRAVLALPLPVVQALDFQPAMPEKTAHALRATPMGAAAKLARATRDRPPPDAHQDLEVPFWSWSGWGGHGRPRRAITAFSGSQPALERLEIQDGDPGEWSRRLQAAHPETVFEGQALLADWRSDPLAGGCYAAFDPPSWALRAALRARHGRVVFAGEHTSDHFGTMEGALESGLRAAADLLEIAGAGSPTRIWSRA